VGAGATCTETYGQSTLKKDLNLKQWLGATFLALWVRANIQSKIWAQGSRKRERTHPVRLTTKARQGNNTTCQHQRCHKVTNQQQRSQVSTKRERDNDAFILLANREFTSIGNRKRVAGINRGKEQ